MEKQNTLHFFNTAKIMVQQLNKEHNFQFEFYGTYSNAQNQNIETFLFCSNYLFKKDNNPKVVGLFINEKKCIINCFHESCKKYEPFEFEIQSKLIDPI